MAGKCCGELVLPKVLKDTTLLTPRIVSPTFVNVVLTTDCNGNPVTERTPVVTCDNLRNGASVSGDGGNIIRPGSDGGAYLGIADMNKVINDAIAAALEGI